VPPIDELTRIAPTHLERLERQGIFTTGLLLEVRDVLAVDVDTFKARLARGARELNLEPPSDLTLRGWWEQARTLEEE